MFTAESHKGIVPGALSYHQCTKVFSVLGFAVAPIFSPEETQVSGECLSGLWKSLSKLNLLQDSSLSDQHIEIGCLDIVAMC